MTQTRGKYSCACGLIYSYHKVFLKHVASCPVQRSQCTDNSIASSYINSTSSEVDYSSLSPSVRVCNVLSSQASSATVVNSATHSATTPSPQTNCNTTTTTTLNTKQGRTHIPTTYMSITSSTHALSTCLPSPVIPLESSLDIMQGRLRCSHCKKRSFKNYSNFCTHFQKFHLSISSSSPLSSFINNINSTTANSHNSLFFQNSILNYFKSNNLSNLLKIGLININSLLNKTNEIWFMLDKQLLDILVINETKLNNLVDDSLFIHIHYHMIRRDRNDDDGCRGGGVMVFVKKTLPHIAEIDKSIELINITIEPKPGYKISLLAGYRPPHPDNEELFFSTLENHVVKADKSVDTFIVGDLNYDILSADQGVSNKLNTFMNTFGFSNSITKGTRYNKNKEQYSLIDVILSYNHIKTHSSEVFDCSFSDHSFVISALDYKNTSNNVEFKQTRCLNEKNLNNIKTFLLSILSTLSLTVLNSDVNLQWRAIKDIIVSIIDSEAPSRRVLVKPGPRVPWMDKELVCLSKQRNKFYNRARKKKNTLDWDLFKLTRNKFKSLFKLKKTLYFNNSINKLSTSSKKLWNKLSPFINPNKKSPICSSLILKNTSTNSIAELALVFSNYFNSILNNFSFTNINTCLSYTNSFFKNISFSFSSSKFEFDRIELEEVVSALEDLDITASPGSVGISTRILKSCAAELGPTLTCLFNNCLTYAEIPNEWKVAYVTPIYKGKGSKSDICNYRPISILSPISKVFESLISKRIRYYLEVNNILHCSQYGFRPRHSCELALNTMVDEWRENLDTDNDVVSLFLDLSKAFDTVDHELLINKLKLYNFGDNSRSLISNYLRNRTNQICINGERSKAEKLEVGVPQGSILGPLLFIIFINDMCYLPLMSRLLLFADDTTVYLFGKRLEDLISNIEDDLILIYDWLSNNRLLINIPKTQAMYLSSKKNNIDLSLHTIHLGNEKIRFVNESKLLGVIIDNKLKFSSHISNLCSKINKKTFLLSKSLYLFTDNFKHIIFKLFIQTYFDYCSTLIIYLSTKKDNVKLEKTFYRAVNSILQVNLLNSTDEERFSALGRFNLLPLSYRKIYYFSNFLYKLLSLTNSKLYIKLIKLKKDNTINTRNVFSQPNFYTYFYKYSFTKVSIEFLNSFLMQYIDKYTKNIDKRKNLSLKKFFISNANSLATKISNFIT